MVIVKKRKFCSTNEVSSLNQKQLMYMQNISTEKTRISIPEIVPQLGRQLNLERNIASGSPRSRNVTVGEVLTTIDQRVIEMPDQFLISFHKFIDGPEDVIQQLINIKIEAILIIKDMNELEKFNSLCAKNNFTESSERLVILILTYFLIFLKLQDVFLSRFLLYLLISIVLQAIQKYYNLTRANPS